MFNIIQLYKDFLIPKWGPGNAGYVSRLHSFPQAHRFFTEARKPRGTKWADSQRPLYNSRAHHYRIEEIEKNCCYDLVLYNTPMVRYYTGGKVLLYGDSSLTSKAFMDANGWPVGGGRHETTDGRTVVVPLNPHASETYTAPNGVEVPNHWSALLMLDGVGRIDTAKSAHRPVFVRRSAEDDKRSRAEFLARHKQLLDLLSLRRTETSVTDWRMGRPFSSALYDFPWPQRHELEDQLRAETLSESGARSAADLASLVYSYLVAAREYRWYANEKPPEVTVEDFRKSLRYAFLKLVGLDTKSDALELPQFSEKLPVKYVFHKPVKYVFHK